MSYFRPTSCIATEMKDIIKKLIEFRNERDWEQFHNPKDLAIALSIEASELTELFLWKNQQEVEEVDKEKVKEELADVLAYALLLLEKYDLDIDEIISEKIKKNSLKYPIEKSKGKATKYRDL